MTIHKSFYKKKTKLPAFGLMRWKHKDGTKGKIGGFFIRGLGRGLMIYSDVG